MPRFQFYKEEGVSRIYGPYDALRVNGKTLELLNGTRWWRIARCFHLENDRVYWKIDKEKDCPIAIREEDLPNYEWTGFYSLA